MSIKNSTAIKSYIATSKSLSDDEKTDLLNLIKANDPWYIIVLKVIKYLGTVAGYFLAGLGLASCSGFPNL